ncbi:MAG: hypothetical protein ACREQY_01205 [Candidatus Binatia bacterium]
MALYLASSGTSADHVRIGPDEVAASAATAAAASSPEGPPVRTAAVSVDLVQMSGLRGRGRALGGWRIEGAVQEGLPRYGADRLAAGAAVSESRGVEMRIRGRRILGRAEASVRVAERNYDPASGLLLADAANPRAVDVSAEGSREVDGAIDLLRDRPIAPHRLLSIRLTGRHERTQPAAQNFAILSTASPGIDELLLAEDATAVAIVGRRPATAIERGRARPSPAPDTRSESLALLFSIAPPAEPERKNPWRTTLGYGYREARRFASVACCRLAWGDFPRVRVSDQKTESHFLSATWSAGPWSVGYRFTLLSPERVAGSPAIVGVALRAHQVDASVHLFEPLAMNLLVARYDSSGDRPGSAFSSFDSRLGLSWSFAPRWSLSESVSALEVSGPGAGTETRSYALESRVARSIRIPAGRAEYLEGQLFARSAAQTDAYRALAAGLDTRQDFWGVDAGIRVTF